MTITITYKQSNGLITNSDGATVDSPVMKRCCYCGEKKSSTDFYKRSGRKCGLQSHCIECTKKKNKEWLQENREYKLKKSRAHYRENKDYWKDTKLRYHYGIGFDRYSQMLEDQGGVCAICGGLDKSGKDLAVDHNHSSGVVRGLLCSACNTAIGSACEDIQILEKMIAYLKRHANDSNV